MPTSATIRTDLRRFLDDFETDHRKGLTWEDDELDLALTMAQYAVARWFYAKSHFHLLSRLVVNVNQPAASPLALPADYLFGSGASVEASISGNLYPAALFIGYGSGVQMPAERRYTATVDATQVVFRRSQATAPGSLTYYRRPVEFGAGTNHVDFIDPVYDVIRYHAAAILQQKDVGATARAMKNVEAVLKRVLGEPAGVFPAMSNEATP